MPGRYGQIRPTCADGVFLTPQSETLHSAYIFDTDHGAGEAISVLLWLEGFAPRFFIHPRKFLFETLQTQPDVLLVNVTADTQVLTRLPLYSQAPIIGLLDENDERPELPPSPTTSSLLALFKKPLCAQDLVGKIKEALSIGHQSRSTVSDPLDALSIRERQVVHLVLNGVTTKDAAWKMGLSARTVEFYRSKAMKKLGAKNTADLVRIATTQMKN